MRSRSSISGLQSIPGIVQLSAKQSSEHTIGITEIDIYSAAGLAL